MLNEDDGLAEELGALAELAEVLLDLAARLAEGGGTDRAVDDLVHLAERCVPRSSAVAIAMADGGRLDTVAATDDVARLIDRLRGEANEGPSLDVIESSDVVVTGEIEGDARWPDFGALVAAETSIHSVATYRLYLGGPHRGALAFYSEWPDAFDALAIAVGAIFAAYASLILTHRFVFDAPVPSGRFRSVHEEIGVAVGILLASGHESVESAYRQLHAVSRQLKVSLQEAARIVHQRGPDEASEI